MEAAFPPLAAEKPKHPNVDMKLAAGSHVGATHCGAKSGAAIRGVAGGLAVCLELESIYEDTCKALRIG